MKQINIEIKQDVKDFLFGISSKLRDFNVYLVGGYLRDMYIKPERFSLDSLYWKAPKDVDIVLIPKGNIIYNVPIECAEGCFITYIKKASEISDMEGRGVHKLIGLRNHKLSTPDIQFIIYGKHLTQQQIAEDMDMNIVQAVWSPENDTTLVTDDFVKGHEDKVIECLHTYDQKRTFSRYERMEKKLKGYNSVGKPEFSKKEKVEIRKTHYNRGGSY